VSGRVRTVAMGRVDVQIGPSGSPVSRDGLAEGREWLADRHGLCWRLRVLAETVEDAVDERRRLRRAVAPGQLDGLVDRPPGGRVRHKEQLISAPAKHVAIDASHARQPAILRRLAESLINGSERSHHAVVETETERLQGRIAEAVVDEPFKGRTVDGRVVVVLEQQLKGYFAGAGTSGHTAVRNLKDFSSWYRPLGRVPIPWGVSFRCGSRQLRFFRLTVPSCLSERAARRWSSRARGWPARGRKPHWGSAFATAPVCSGSAARLRYATG